MPTLRRTPFNPNGSLVADPLDEIESQNRNAAMRAAESSNMAAQNNAASQLALARLKQSDYQFGQGRADQTAMFREKLAADQHGMELNANLTREGWGREDSRFGKQFDYLAGRDQMMDTRYRDDQAWERDPNKNPALQAQMTTAAAQAKLAEYMQEERERQKQKDLRTDKAADAVPAEPFTDPEERDLYNVLVAQGQAPAMANQGVRAKRKEKAIAADDADIENLSAQVGDLHRRDTTLRPSWLAGETDPDDAEVAKKAQEIDAAAARIAAAEGIPLGQAKARIAAKLRAAAPRGGLGSDMTDALYQKLGWL